MDPLWFSAFELQLLWLYLALCEEVGVFLSCRLPWVQPLHGSSLGSGLCLIGYGHTHISTPSIGSVQDNTFQYSQIYE